MRAWLLAGTALAALGAAGPAGAQDNADAGTAMTQEEMPVVTLLDTVTVVSRTGETPIETLASVSHVGEEELQRRLATTPQDIFFGMPGVTIQADAKRSASSINIRGLQDFGRVAVIVDGARQNFQRSGHGTESVFFIDPALIKQVDVIRGPVANTYGSGAIGGVVFFETKDAEDFLRPGERWAGSLTGGYESNGGGWTTSAIGAVRLSDDADILGNIVYRDYGTYEDGAGNDVEGSDFDVVSGMLKSTLRPTEFSTLKLGWIGTNESWKEGSGTSDIDLDQNTFTARYHVTDPDTSWLDLHINGSYNNTGLDQTYRTDVEQYSSVTGLPITVPAGSRTTYDLDTYGIDIWNTSRFDTGALSHELTYGGDYLRDNVDTASPAGGSDIYTPSGNRQLWGAYVQDRITFSRFEVIGGLRYDNYSLDGDDAENNGDRLSPRITVGVSPFDAEVLRGLQFYGTYAEGYRAPTVTETLISGLHPNGVVFPFLPNPNLKPETAKTWEAGVNYSADSLFQAGDRLRLKAAYFHNDIKDFIDGQNLSAFDPTSGCTFTPGPGTIPICYQYRNFADARIHGIELEAAYDAGRYFVGLSGSIIDGYRTAEGEREDLVTTPSSQVTASLGFRFLEDRLTLGGEVQHNEAPDGAEYADDYTLVNLFANYQATENFRLDFRVDNLFDVKYANPLNATTTTPIYEPGLSVKVAATLRFGG